MHVGGKGVEIPPGREQKFAVAAVLILTAILACACFGSIAGPGTLPRTTVKPSIPPSLTTELFAGGLKALDDGQPSEALADFKGVLYIDPNNAFDVTEANYDIGVVYADEANDAEADQYFENALSVTPTYQPALIDLALLETKSDPAKALPLYKRLEVIDPNDPTVDSDYGHALIATGQTALGNEEIAIANSLLQARAGGTSSAPTTTAPAKKAPKLKKTVSSSSTSST
jgi:tetratricopeptide (TPR) repeat protein